MDHIRAVIADDEAPARRRIKRLLTAYPEVTVLGECKDGRQVADMVRRAAPDLLFLDIQMPSMSGLHVVEEIGVGQVPAVIFVTAYDEHALRAFELHALDYLLKPFDRSRFQQAFERARTQIQLARRGGRDPALQSLLEDLRRGMRPLGRFAVKTKGRIEFIRHDEIDWVEAEDNYSRLHVGGNNYLVRQAIGSVEANLDPEAFCRVHRSTIINVDRVKAMQPLFNGDQLLTLRDGTRLTVSRTYRDKLLLFLRKT